MGNRRQFFHSTCLINEWRKNVKGAIITIDVLNIFHANVFIKYYLMSLPVFHYLFLPFFFSHPFVLPPQSMRLMNVNFSNTFNNFSYFGCGVLSLLQKWSSFWVDFECLNNFCFTNETGLKF